MSPDNARILKHKESFGLQRIGEDTSWPKMPLLKIKIAVSLCIVDNVAGVETNTWLSLFSEVCWIYQFCLWDHYWCVNS